MSDTFSKAEVITGVARRRRFPTDLKLAVVAIQAGLVAGLEIHDQAEAILRAFQLLMFALATTGLMLGAVVSERRRLSDALADSASRRATILNTARDGILTIDARGQIQSIN